MNSKQAEISVNGNEVHVPVEVKNIGSKYAGKEVVQVYYSAIGGEIDKPYQELAAYKKTKLLAPGESEQLVLTYPVSQMASYSEQEAAWVLEQGEYVIRVGNSSASTVAAGVAEVKESVKTVIAKNLFALDVELKEIRPDAGKLAAKKQASVGAV